jgi:hypothetical protein
MTDFTNWALFGRRLLPTVLVWLDHCLWTIINFAVMVALVLLSIGVYLSCDWWRLGHVRLARRYLTELPRTVRRCAAAFGARLAKAACRIPAILRSLYKLLATRLRAASRILPAAVVAVLKSETRKWPPPPPGSGRRSGRVPVSAVNSETPNIHAPTVQGTTTSPASTLGTATSTSTTRSSSSTLLSNPPCASSPAGLCEGVRMALVPETDTQRAQAHKCRGERD